MRWLVEEVPVAVDMFCPIAVEAVVCPLWLCGFDLWPVAMARVCKLLLTTCYVDVT